MSGKEEIDKVNRVGKYSAGYDEPVNVTYTFRCCWVNMDESWTETVFHDGTRVVATPEPEAAYGAHAQDLGYGDGPRAVAQMSREHEWLHSFLADRLDGGASPTLWAVAHGQIGNVAPIWEQEIEEARVLGFQRYLNGQDGVAEIQRLLDHGVDVVALKQEAIRVLRTENIPPTISTETLK